MAAFLSAACLLVGCGGGDQNTVVVYSSMDAPFAEQVFSEFQKQTGLRVVFVPDAEASKTTGLVNRLILEKDRPRADVWWSNEWFGTQQLAAAGVLEAYRPPTAGDLPAGYRDEGGLWTAFAARPRVLVYNTSFLRREDLPTRIGQLTAAPWRGRVTMADPRFGTTRGWAAAMLVKLGEAEGKRFLIELRASCPTISAGNSGVVRTVARAAAAGDVVLGLTDADDVHLAKARGEPVDMAYLDQEEGGIGTLLIPNSVALVRGAPHPAAARRLIEFLASAHVERMLADSDSRNIPLRPVLAAEYPQLRVEKPMDVDSAEVARQYERLNDFLDETFGR
jgi:iron(III) transport system substrate-binding protein